MKIGLHQFTLLDIVANSGGRLRQFILFDIRFRPARDGIGWVFEISVCRIFHGSSGTHARSLFHLDYTHPSRSLSRDLCIAIGFSKDFVLVHGEHIT